MDGTVSRTALKCSGRTLVEIRDHRFVWVRCRERNCRDVRRARERGLGERVYHVKDIVTGATWTEIEPADPAEK